MVSKTIIQNKRYYHCYVICNGEELAEKISTFETYIQIMDGAAELMVNQQKHNFALGTGFIIPANAAHNFNACEQFE